MTTGGRRISGALLASQLREGLQRLFDELTEASQGLDTTGWVPATDILDIGPALLVAVEVPGLRVEDLEVAVEGGVLEIRGRHHQHYPPEARFHCLERSHGTFRRRLDVGQPVDFSRARCRLAAGLLMIELPKVDERRQRRQPLTIRDLDADDD